MFSYNLNNEHISRVADILDLLEDLLHVPEKANMFRLRLSYKQIRAPVTRAEALALGNTLEVTSSQVTSIST